MSGKVVLGRGLEALIPKIEKKVEEGTYGTVQEIALEKIVPNPMQPRRQFDEKALESMAESVKSQGVLQPVLVRKKDDKFILIAGERRFRAAKLAGLKAVPAITLERKDESEMLQMALVENIQREDLNPMEEAEAYRQLVDEAGLTQNQIATQVGKSRTAIANTLRLLNLPDKIKTFMREGKLTEGHARAILALDNDLARVRLAERIVAESLSVRTAEDSVKRVKRRKLIPKKRIPAMVDAENYLKQLLGTGVKISTGLKNGKIEIEFYGEEDLDRILDLFRRIS